MEFRHVVPLGSRCRTTHNIRLHFGGGVTFPFDWFILPLAGLVTVLEEGMDAGLVYDEAGLGTREDERGRVLSVMNRRLSIDHHHDFPRLAGEELAPGWKDHLPAVRHRFARAADRFRAAAAEGEVLYVRERHGSDDPALLSRLDGLLRAMTRDGTSHLLAVNYAEGSVPPGIESVRVQEDATLRHGWRGDGKAWSAAFGSTGHRLRR